MTAQEYIKHQVKMCRTEWFKTHVLTTLVDHSYRWAKPDSSIYLIDYVIHGRYLIVVGDAGDAIYHWSQMLTWDFLRLKWDFLRELDLDYFVGKCQASQVGRKFVHWESRVAQTWLEEFLKENEVARDSLDPEPEFGSSQEFMQFIQDNHKIFGSDYFKYGDVGEVLHPRAIGHWVGLQMALGGKRLSYYE